VSLPCYGSAGDACACVHAESAAPPAAPAAADPLQHGGQPLQPSLQPGHLEAAALCPAATAGCRAAAVQFLAGTALHAAGNDLSPAAAALHPAETAAESGPRHGRLQAALLAGAAADLASVAALQPATGQQGVFTDRLREGLPRGRIPVPCKALFASGLLLTMHHAGGFRLVHAWSDVAEMTSNKHSLSERDACRITLQPQPCVKINAWPTKRDIWLKQVGQCCKTHCT
jgi:hypothetical protein